MTPYSIQGRGAQIGAGRGLSLLAPSHFNHCRLNTIGLQERTDRQTGGRTGRRTLAEGKYRAYASRRAAKISVSEARPAHSAVMSKPGLYLVEGLAAKE